MQRTIILKRIIKYTVVQVLLLLFFGLLINAVKPYDIDDCISESLVVQDVEYRYKLNEAVCIIQADNTSYRFPSLGIFGEYSARELFEAIKSGHCLEITYTKRQSLFGKYNLVVDARNDTATYIDFNSYNEQKESALVFAIIISILIELIFLAVIAFIIILDANSFKALLQRKNKT